MHLKNIILALIFNAIGIVQLMGQCPGTENTCFDENNNVVSVQLKWKSLESLEMTGAMA